MKNVLIIYPHWPPSNLAGMHRPRLLANFLPEFGWQPIVLTVHPDYYEEVPDYDLMKTVSEKVIVHHVKALRLNRKISFIGDIGIRALYHLYKGALRIIDHQKIDFVFIPIPSFYTALLGRILYEKRKIPYGIDYIDPWIQLLDPHTRLWSKAGISNQLARILEPIAVKKAALLSGVASSYYEQVIKRNFKNRAIDHIGMPYGFDPADHEVQLPHIATPWSHINDCKSFVYAGAFLPKSHLFIELLFASIQQLISEKRWDPAVNLFFLGTGNYKGKTITDYASQYGIGDHVHEVKQRFPFLHILNFLSKAFGVMVIGSTEKHYTASKTFQALLSKKPVFAILHEESSAVIIVQALKADPFLVTYSENMDLGKIRSRVSEKLLDIINATAAWKPNLSSIHQYSAKQSAKVLAEKLDQIVSP